jgi:protein associated with RNAse G/E
MLHSESISSKMENKTGPSLYYFFAAWFNLKVLSRTSKRKHNDNTNTKHPVGKEKVKYLCSTMRQKHGKKSSRGV